MADCVISGTVTGTELFISAWAIRQNPGGMAAITRAAIAVEGCSAKQRIYDYQALCLFALAAQYNRDGARILEIGTYYGYSAGVLAQACPLAHIDTLNPTPWEWDRAFKNLKGFSNVNCFCSYSWDYFKDYAGPDYDLIFCDGDHKRIHEDLGWWNRINPGGLFLFHDYSPSDSARPCPPVYRALQGFGDDLGRDPDILIVDDRQVGMAGWYKGASDV